MYHLDGSFKFEPSLRGVQNVCLVFPVTLGEMPCKWVYKFA